MTWQTLTDSLADLERGDPAVAAAARSFDLMVDDLTYRAALHDFRPLPWDHTPVPLDCPVVADGGGVTHMTIARCLVDPAHCEWEVDFPDDAAAKRGRDRHEALRHPETLPVEPTAPAEPHVPQPLQQLANVDWWTQVMDGIARLASESLRTGEPFTVFEVARFGVGEPINPQYDWGKATRDAVHLELIVHATDGEGRELSTRSPRPATKGSLVSLWRPGPAVTGTPKTRSQSA